MMYLKQRSCLTGSRRTLTKGGGVTYLLSRNCGSGRLSLLLLQLRDLLLVLVCVHFHLQPYSSLVRRGPFGYPEELLTREFLIRIIDPEEHLQVAYDILQVEEYETRLY